MPGPGQAFELVFWKPGAEPLTDSFGLAAASSATQITVDLEAVSSNLGSLMRPGSYFWGVLLVETEPYNRLRLVSEGRMIEYSGP